MGRLFDAVSSLVRLKDKINYEGQAAIELEQLANQIGNFPHGKSASHVRESPGRTGGIQNYKYEIMGADDILIIKPGKIIAGIVEDISAKVSPSVISARFHNTISDIIVNVCKRIREETGLNEVALSGGVFQNMILLNKTFDDLGNEGFKVYIHHRVPANDGGICLGQAVIAGARLRTKVKD
jgi:hydrogenase maturation protein HypF